MKQKIVRAAVVCALTLAASVQSPLLAQAAAGADKVINSEGIAAIEKGDIPGARDRALDDALRKAVEQAVGTLIESETMVQNYQVLNDSIYSQTKGFVRTYKITSEKQDGPIYRVAVAATVAVGDVQADLQSLGLLIQRMRKPRVIVMIPEDNIHDHGWWSSWTANIGTVEMEIIKALKAKEFIVMDAVTVRKTIDKESALKALEGDNEAAGRIALQTGAEVFITGQAVAQPAGSIAGSPMNSYQASVNARAVKADTGEILGTASGQGKAAHLNSTAGGNEALRQAGGMLAGDLIRQITTQWAKEASGSRMLALSVTGLSKDLVDDLATELKAAVRGVADVFQREYAEGTARLDVDFKGDAETLSKALRGFAVAGGKLEITAVTANKINARFLAGS